MDLYRIKPKLTKVAGRRISPNPQQWSADIIKALRQDHPYADLAGASPEFHDADPDSGTAHGTVALSPRVSVIFSIRPDTLQRKPELDPLDILVENGRYRAFTEASYREAMTGSAVGASKQPKNDQDRYSVAPTTNPYVGDMTGDTSPLEAGNLGLSNMVRASTMRTASMSSLTPGLVTKRDTLGRLLNTLAAYPHIDRAMESYGLKQSLIVAGAGVLAKEEDHPDTLVVTRGKGLSFNVRFSNGEQRVCTRRDLEDMLMSSAPQVMRQVMRHGMATVREVAELGSVDLDGLSIQAPVIQAPGTYDIDTGDCSCSLRGWQVVRHLMDVDGSILDDTKWHAFDPVMGEYLKPCELLRGMKSEACLDGVQTDEGAPASGLTRFWFKEVRALSPVFKVERFVEVPGGDAVYVAQMQDGTKRRFGWRFVESLARPVKMPHSEARGYGLDVPLYLVPVNAELIPVAKEATEVGAKTQLKMAQAEREAVVVQRLSPSEWRVSGQSGVLSEDMILKLAGRGVPEARLVELWSAPTGHTDKLWLPKVAAQEPQTKQAARWISPELRQSITALSKTAQEVAEGLDQAMGQGQPQVDPRTLDAVLALNMASDENLEQILQAKPLFDEAEDKIARLVLASRLGKDTLDEDGLTRALRGMGAVHRALQVLSVEQEVSGYQ